MRRTALSEARADPADRAGAGSGRLRVPEDVEREASERGEHRHGEDADERTRRIVNMLAAQPPNVPRDDLDQHLGEIIDRLRIWRLGDEETRLRRALAETTDPEERDRIFADLIAIRGVR